MSKPTYPTEVPGKCLRAYRALRGFMGETTFSRFHGCYRYDDIIELTGKRCDDRKLRDLIEWDRHLVCRQDWRGDSGRVYRVFWLNPDYPKPPIGFNLDMAGTKNPPAVPPHDVRLIPRKAEGYAPVLPGRDGLLFDFALPGGAA